MRPEGWFTEADAELYIEVCSKVPKGGIVVEVGSYKGRSASYVGPVLKGRATLVCTDSFVGINPPPKPDFEGRKRLRRELEQNLNALGLLGDPVRVIQCESTCASQMYDNNSLDAVYIDAMHDAHSVRLDIEHWWPKIKPGGWIMGHDYAPYHPGVIQMVNQRFQAPQRRSGATWGFRKMPTYIAIETCAQCNRSCSFCPTNNTVFPPKEFMSEEKFDWCLQQLVDWEYTGKIALYGHNEALIDKRVVEFSKRIATRLPKCSHSLSTNGDLLTEQKLIDLFEAGVCSILVNGYDQKSYDKSNEMLSRVCSEQGFKLVKVPASAPLFPMQGNPGERTAILYDATQIGPKTWGLSSRAGNVKEGLLPVLKEPLQANCIRPTTHMHVKWNGNCILCCNDWSQEVILGNAFEVEGIKKAYGSSLLYYYQKRLGGGYRSGLTLCEQCDWQ
jgi:ferredoxin